MFILRQSTAVDVLIGPFVDGTDGATVEEAESPSVQLSKNGQTAATKNEGTTPAIDNAGMYNCVFDATDTNTVGTLVAFVEGSPSTFLQVRHEFQIMDTAAFDALFADGAEGPLQATTVGRTLDILATGEVPIDFDTSIGTLAAAQIEASALDGKGDWNTVTPPTAVQNRTEMDTNSTKLITLSDGIIEGVTSGTPTTTSTDTDLSGFLDSELVGRVIVFTENGGTADGQAAVILTYTSTNGVVTFAALTTAPVSSDTFKIV